MGVSRYAPYYCEENVWYLAQDDRFKGFECIVAIITGLGPRRPLWYQRAAEHEELPVWWDYHVILLYRDLSWMVWDPDTILDLPVDAIEYLRKTFLDDAESVESADVVFRLINAEEYVLTFSSDRSHMKLSGGRWIAPPPPWPPILQGPYPILHQLLDVSIKTPGKLITLAELLRKLCTIATLTD